MDPSTTLITFMLQTHPSVQSVHLIGSWDNFSKYYAMERDSRRDRGQWKGCYSFKDIIDHDLGREKKRNGGLKMGRNYYYFYELDGSHEVHDPTLPSTNICPYLPGQTVNTLYVPVEKMLKKRSVSLSSIRNTDFKTMNPEDKFVTPRPPPPVPSSPGFRIGSSPTHPLSRSMSPTPSWKRIFGLRRSPSGVSDQDRRSEADELNSQVDDTRSITSSEGTRTRDISPASLLRFLSDDIPLSQSSSPEEKPVVIPEEISEENEDDENFATSAVSENSPYATCLSPPPFKRSGSSSSSDVVEGNEDSLVTLIGQAVTTEENEVKMAPVISTSPQMDLLGAPRSRFSVSTISSVESLSSPQSPEDEVLSLYDSNDDEDVLSSNEDALYCQPLSLPSTRKQSIDQASFTYSLPQSVAEGSKKLDVPASYGSHCSPTLLARNDAGMPVGSTSLLTVPIDAGLDDLTNDLSWVVDIIRGKGQ